MPPKNNVTYGCKGYFMITLDDGTVYEVVGSVEDMSFEETFSTVYASNEKFYTPNNPNLFTVRMERERSFKGTSPGLFTPKRIIRNGPALIVFWWDGTKTVVKCHNEDFDVEKGLAMALCRKMWGRSRTEHFLKKVEEQG